MTVRIPPDNEGGRLEAGSVQGPGPAAGGADHQDVVLLVVLHASNRDVWETSPQLRSGNRITFRFAERSGIIDYNVIWQPSLLVMDVEP